VPVPHPPALVAVAADVMVGAAAGSGHARKPCRRRRQPGPGESTHRAAARCPAPAMGTVARRELPGRARDGAGVDLAARRRPRYRWGRQPASSRSPVAKRA